MVDQAVAAPAEVAAAARTPRRHELDWLRALVVLCVVIYHAAGIFSAGTNLYLQDPEGGWRLNVAASFLNAWAMPLLFVIAGATALFSLRRRTAAEYAGNRFVRLVIPFLFGTLALVPVQVYVAALSDPSLLRQNPVPISDPHFLDSYPAFYVQYLSGYWYFLGHFSPQLEAIFWGHLWFVAYLAVYSFVTLPVLLLLGTRAGKRLIGLLSRALSLPGGILLLGLPPGLAFVVTRSGPVRGALVDLAAVDWGQAAVLLICFLYGYILYADARCLRAVLRGGPLALALGVCAFGLALWLSSGAVHGPFVLDATRIAQGFVAWLWVAAVMSFGLRFLNATNRLLPYVTEAAYPIYVIHMPLLLLVAVVVLPLRTSLAGQFALLVVGALALSLALYDLAIRRFRVTRFLFGLDPRKAANHQRPASAIRPDEGMAVGG